jgi:predicted N-acetyltransferase YhbS
MLQRLMAVEAAWCRRGIGSKLVEENLKLAQRRKKKMVVAD